MLGVLISRRYLLNEKTIYTMNFMNEPVAVFFTDLNLQVDQWQSGATWTELLSGSRSDVVSGAPIVVTDDEDAFAATVTNLSAPGPLFVIHWDRKVSLPVSVQRATSA